MNPDPRHWINHNRQPLDSGRVTPEQTLSWQNQQQLQQVHQVDSWRSYSDDATNLQQLANLDSNYSYIDSASPAQSQAHPAGHSFNPAAIPFQPAHLTYAGCPTQSHFTPYQPLRISNGQWEKFNVHQARFNSTSTQKRGRGHYALRSQANTSQLSALQDLPLASIERHHLSSVPINSRLPVGTEAFHRRVVTRGSPSATPPPAPSPTQQYLAQASQPPDTLAVPQKLLVVVDLNGTLLKRSASHRTSFVLRPGVTNLMDYLFANHVVMVYTSSRPENAQGMVNKLLSPNQRKQLVAVWARDKLDLTRTQYLARVQTYKKLERIWADEGIQKTAGEGQSWSQRNTILLDDSHLKGLAQPYNLLRVEEFRNDRPQANAHNGEIKDRAHLEALNVWNIEQQRVVDDIRAKLDDLKFSKDVSQLICMWQKHNTEKEEVVDDQSFEVEQSQLLTPKSPEPQVNSSNRQAGDRDMQSDRGINVVADLRGRQTSDDNGSDRSVSPIDESIWKDILGGFEDRKDTPPTPNSIDD